MSHTRRAVLISAVILGGVAACSWNLVAQDTPPAKPIRVAEALERPVSLPFREDTTLAAVAEKLNGMLGRRVVLDRAAMGRKGLKDDDTIKIDLPEGVRLSTGLKLLLDQVEMTYKVVPEDNLLILTDSEGAAEPLGQVLGEIKSLHRDVHDIQDTVEEIRAVLGLDEGGAELRKPTIIEEMPPGEKPQDRPKKGRPGV